MIYDHRSRKETAAWLLPFLALLPGLAALAALIATGWVELRRFR